MSDFIVIPGAGTPMFVATCACICGGVAILKVGLDGGMDGTVVAATVAAVAPADGRRPRLRMRCVGRDVLST